MRTKIASAGVMLALLLAGLFVWLKEGRNSQPVGSQSNLPPASSAPGVAATQTNPSATQSLRLRNTSRSAAELLRDDRVVLLANAVIDVRAPEAAVPEALRAGQDNGTWLVVARDPLDDAFRAMLAAAGAQIISFIPNNAELVRANAEQVQRLKASHLVASVLAYHPYYKVADQGLLNLAVKGQEPDSRETLRLGLYSDQLNATLAQLKALHVEVGSPEPTPFGYAVAAHPPKGGFLEVVRLDGVMVVEREHSRKAANDLLRVTLGVAANSVTNSDYLGLSGSNVLMGVVDSGVDASHPDLTNRVVGDVPASLVDTNGHGTHVIATILGSGAESSTVPYTNASGSVSNALYSGIATNARAIVIGIPMGTRPRQSDGSPPSDAYVQQTLAQSNVSIINLSWNYSGNAAYDLHAASYDWATRDGLPGVPGSQGALYVVSAGNDGGGAEDGSGGLGDTILSPATAKNVLTVGALEQMRQLTNLVADGFGGSNALFFPETDSSNEVADLSSRGNVGIQLEGGGGRFKPDLVAPGMFVISAKSAQWNQNEYYNPSNEVADVQYNQSVTPGNLTPYSLVVPPNAVGVIIGVVPNEFSPSPFPNLPLYVRIGDNPSSNTFDFLGTNVVSLPGNLPLNPGSQIFYSLGDPTTEQVSFDVVTVIISTNANNDPLNVLSNLNVGLGPYYRYESGTSMAAAGVSGLAALMEEYLTNRLGLAHPSPALLKALLINGARTISSQYDFNTQSVLNEQGWGLPNLSNSIPGSLTNSAGTGKALWYFDQTNQLATGQSQTRMLTVASNAMTQPLRVTLVWTDPPGNPAAGLKLVNDLDLVVSNRDTGDVYYGNDIPAGSDFTESSGTNGTPHFDSVNNVENVYLFPPLSTNYSVTVQAHRVNVNAVDLNTTQVGQDYALVMSAGDGGALTNALVEVDMALVASNQAVVGVLSNGVPLLGERVGANFQLAPTTNGVLNQWNFYVFTNTGTNAFFTNVAFVTFSPANLGVPRMGVFQTGNPANGVRTEADVDLYVSQDATLTNLNLAAVNAAYQSRTRSGTEKVLLTNSMPGQVYYIGVKSEDQQGAQYGFLGVALTNSFNQSDTNGNTILTLLSPVLPAAIPAGSPDHPGSVLLLAVTANPVQVRKVMISDTVTHQDFGDLVGAVTHVEKTAVLNNHSFFTNINHAQETFVYDDSGENDSTTFDPLLYPPARHTDGPGDLTTFIGDTASDGIWTLVMANDSSLSDVGTIDRFVGKIAPQNTTNGIVITLPANSWFYDFVDVPAAATNLQVTVGLPATNSAAVDLYVRRGALPNAVNYDKFLVVNPPGTNLNLSIYDSPPLNPGRYFIGVYNPNPFAETVNLYWLLGLSPSGVTPQVFLSRGNEPLLDDAVTYSTNHVANASRVDSVEVGVRIDHPRVSDLVLTLVSPSGTRVLLSENRGANTTNYGMGVNITNVLPVTNSGGYAGDTNVIDVHTNQGTLIISYNFYTVPDDLRIYYDGNRIYDTGLVNGASTVSVDFGPGNSSTVSIVMNEPGTNPTGTNGDLWTYQATEVTKQLVYAWFSEDTNKTITPIKFAQPPFGQQAANLPPVTVMTSSFEGYAEGDYTNIVDGWTVGTNPVKVVTVGALAATENNAISGNNVLALHSGIITRSLPTIPGVAYTLSFASHGQPVANAPVGWWKGEGNTLDSTANHNDGSPSGGFAYVPGLVGQAFNFDGISGTITAPNSTSLTLTKQITMEAWVATYTTTGDQSILSKLSINSGNNGYQYDFSGNYLYGQFNSTGQPWNTQALGTPVPIVLGAWTYVAFTYDQSAERIYFNGQLVGTMVVGPEPINTSPADFRISGVDNHTYFNGSIDEPTVYSNALSIVQIQDIYAAGSAGKQPVGQSNAVRASISLAGVTNTIFSSYDAWQTNYYTFVAPSSNLVLTISNLDNGVLLDSFQLTQAAQPNPANYYLPEESLAKLNGQTAQGDWKLEVLDNRAGATNNPTPNLASWALSLITDRTNPDAIQLTHAIPNTNTVAAGFIAYYYVDVPIWAKFATNILITASSPVNVLFNQNQLPNTGGTDINLLGSPMTNGSFTITSNTPPPLVPGQRYYLGVQNNNGTPVTFTIEVDFDITTLTNMVPITNQVLAASTVPRYFQYDVSSNAWAVAYELFNLSGNVDLVASKGPPLPDLNTYTYLSANGGTNNELILVTSNSAPVALAPGRWYLGVFNRDTLSVNYTIEALELGMPTIIPLTNDQVLATNFSPVQSLDTFFEFDITNEPPAALFELYALNGNVDLNVDLNQYPWTAPFFAASANPGTNNEQVVLRTNQLGMALDGAWFLGVANNTGSNVNFTVHAVVSTNGLLISQVPLNPVLVVVGGPGPGPTLTWSSVNGENYQIDVSSDLVHWTTIAIVTASGQLTSFTDPTPITGPARFYRITQVP